MKTTLIAAACVFALSTAGALAQSSQGDTGPGTMNNKSMVNPPDRTTNNPGMNSTATTGMNSGMSNSNMGSGGMNNDGTARNPSGQGNAGPGTDSTRPAGR